jgi:hypothetical protein
MLPAVLTVGTVGVLLSQQKSERDTPNTGYSDTPVIPGQKWKVHDKTRPAPPVVTPGAKPGDPPSDAIVLFDGKNLDAWYQNGRGAEKGKQVPAKWKVENGYMEVVGGTGTLVSKEKFGDAQFHIEWASPASGKWASQWKGNSGILLMSRYEVQVLDSHNAPTYPDGQAGAIYGWWPPMVNASKPTGQWQTYDIIFEAPKFENGQVVKKPYVTVIHNGVVLHHHQEIGGPMAHRKVEQFVAHGAEESLSLQDHDTQVRYRNIWVRKLNGYDHGQPYPSSSN